MQLFLVPEDHAYGGEIMDVAGLAARALDLERHLRTLTLIVDDISADERAWLRDCGDGRVELFCHESHFQPPRTAVFSMMPANMPWEFRKQDEPRDDLPAFSRSDCERHLHHQFLALRDLLDGSVRPGDIPANMVEAFQEVWAVSIDGRLRRNSMPGLTIAERRRIFYRIFAGGGVLMPQHWEIFHELWNCDHPDHAALLDWVCALPGLAQPRNGQE